MWEHFTTFSTFERGQNSTNPSIAASLPELWCRELPFSVSVQFPNPSTEGEPGGGRKRDKSWNTLFGLKEAEMTPPPQVPAPVGRGAG